MYRIWQMHQAFPRVYLSDVELFVYLNPSMNHGTCPWQPAMRSQMLVRERLAPRSPGSGSVGAQKSSEALGQLNLLELLPGCRSLDGSLALCSKPLSQTI